MILKLVSKTNIIQVFPVKNVEIFDPLVVYSTEDNVRNAKTLDDYKTIELIDLNYILYKTN